MIRIAITQAAFDAIAKTLPAGSYLNGFVFGSEIGARARRQVPRNRRLADSAPLRNLLPPYWVALML